MRGVIHHHRQRHRNHHIYCHRQQQQQQQHRSSSGGGGTSTSAAPDAQAAMHVSGVSFAATIAGHAFAVVGQEIDLSMMLQLLPACRVMGGGSGPAEQVQNKGKRERRRRRGNNFEHTGPAALSQSCSPGLSS